MGCWCIWPHLIRAFDFTVLVPDVLKPVADVQGIVQGFDKLILTAQNLAIVAIIAAYMSQMGVI